MLNMRDLIPWRSDRTPSTERRDGGSPLETLHRDIDRLFDDMWRGFDRPVFGSMGGLPSVEVAEDEGEYRVSAELPGMDEKDVEVILRDGTLTIRGEKKAETSEKKEGYTYSERSYGTFERTFPLAGDVKSDEVHADFHNGILTVSLPKTDEARKRYRKIPVTNGGAKS